MCPFVIKGFQVQCSTEFLVQFAQAVHWKPADTEYELIAGVFSKGDFYYTMIDSAIMTGLMF